MSSHSSKSNPNAAAERITIEEVHNALNRSGYLLEYRVEQLIRRRHLAAFANVALTDPVTGKSRELDLSAMSAEEVASGEYVFPMLLIECVNNPQPMAFFTKSDLAPTANLYDIRFSGIPLKVETRSNKWSRLTEFIGIQEYHHHCRGRVSTQYCSFSKKKGQEEWLASHDDTHFDSFHKLCNAIEDNIADHLQNSRFTIEDEEINLQVYYPLLVVAGGIVDVRSGRDGIKITESNHIHYVQSHSSNNRDEKYHIDVVSEAYLPLLISTIEKEVTLTAQRIAKKKAKLKRSVNKIARSVQGVSELGERRELLGYRIW